ncbi:MAG: acetyl-CoA carboxylase biotin carboxylase subunit [Actinobacteria bacterium]|nr:acetyl-CoA carboxylase biotin carboxylase subunit [Actinomycetota bacterium]
MLSKILIANRGEIALRVMRTCRELGIPTVAVYSDVDRDAAHVRYADEAYALGGQTAAESYLNTDAILGVIDKCGADGVHPGYGFYAENADFARVVAERGVAWIGPPPEAIEVMGDKISARRAADRGGVASVPGTLDPIESVDDVIAFGEKAGWPVAIKAAYGGGGKGMKVVHDAEGAQAALDSAAREAQAYFGRAEAYLEKYLTHPRHIEIQVFADTLGNAVWLGERDCSVQRRHQKLIEESPAAGLDKDTRRAMGEAAVQVARACGYVNAGTVEMLYQDGEFYFLEMNTRLQVEHCVTEMVTKLDLVAEQIRVASGEPLSITEDSIIRRGHAIECRINAENAAKGFGPSPGTITKLVLPAGPEVRWDGGYDEGDTVSQYYDNLVGKLIVWGPDRDTARHRMLRALQELVIEGIHTTVPAHQLVLTHPDFATANHSTRWLEEQVDTSALVSQAAADKAPPETEELTPQVLPVEVDGRRFQVKVWLPDAGIAHSGGGAKQAPRPRAAASTHGSGSGMISAPMQGTIVKVLIAVGDAVEPGQALLVLEAMKMENHLNAEQGGTVAEIRVSAGDTVGTGDVLVVIE